MKVLPISIFFLLLSSCSTGLRCKDYFGVRSASMISIISDSLCYLTDSLDLSMGVKLRPIMKYDYSFDTLSHYRVVACGNVIFHKSNIDEESTSWEAKIDSVTFDYIIVRKRDFPAEFYSYENKTDAVLNMTPWNKRSLPDSILLKIREDFYVRMKYTKYIFNNDIRLNGISVTYPYELYNSGRNF